MDYNKIGNFIMTERKAKKLTQAKLAEKIFVSEKTISKWEKGKSLPDTNTLPKLCEILGVSLNELLSGEKIIKENNNQKANKLYYAQLVVNSLWSILFFRFKLFAVSTLWLVLLLVLVSFMIYEFYKLNKKAALINITYLLWITFAFILNYSIYLLN